MDITVRFIGGRVKGLEAGSHNHRTDLDSPFHWLHLIIDGLGQTGLNTLITLGADTALKTPLGLSPGPILGEPQGDLLISPAALG
jgi:hypothetical protein